MRRGGARSRGGVTFLEVVFASAMLGIATSGFVAALGAVETLDALSARRLEAHEVAHRVLLQFMDDPRSLREDTPYPLGRGVYRYIVRKDVLLPEDAESERVSIRKSAHTKTLDPLARIKARLTMITVEVFEEEQGRRGTDPLATLSRIYDPFADAENDPQTFMQHVVDMFEGDPVMQQMLMQALPKMGGAGQQGQTGAPAGRSGQTQPGAPAGGGAPRRIQTGGGGQR